MRGAAATMAERIWVREARAILDESDLRVLKDVPMRHRTYLGVGGPAAVLVEPDNVDQLAAALRRLNEAGVPFEYLGAGSNLLVADEGPPFVVIASEALAAEPRVDGATVTVGAGYPVPRLVKRLLDASLSGLEFAEGIPGSVGGCVRMNAGWHEGAFGQAVASLTVIARHGEIEELPVTPATFAYRRSPGVGDRFVAAATLALAPDDPARIAERIRGFHDHRVRTQPVGARNAGCIFRNPEGDHAGRLIDAAGLKGRSVGAAVVSDTHANFIINRGGATFADIAALIETIQDEVLKKTGVRLEPEVARWA